MVRHRSLGIGRTLGSAIGVRAFFVTLAAFAAFSVFVVLVVFGGFGAVGGFGELVRSVGIAETVAFAGGPSPSWDRDLESAIGPGDVVPITIGVAIPRIDLHELGRRHGFELDLRGAEAVNQALREHAMALIEELLPFGNVTGGYDVHVETPRLLSVTMQYSGYLPPMAHPMHLRASVTANPETGGIYTLADLFIDDRYLEVLSEAVALGIEEQELPLLVSFDEVSPDQDFYLTAESLVLYYQLYELVPYAWGFPEFEIPLDSLREIAREDGPIAALLALE